MEAPIKVAAEIADLRAVALALVLVVEIAIAVLVVTDLIVDLGRKVQAVVAIDLRVIADHVLLVRETVDHVVMDPIAGLVAKAVLIVAKLVLLVKEIAGLAVMDPIVDHVLKETEMDHALKGIADHALSKIAAPVRMAMVKDHVVPRERRDLVLRVPERRRRMLRSVRKFLDSLRKFSDKQKNSLLLQKSYVDET
jgi:hypothetical protein